MNSNHKLRRLIVSVILVGLVFAGWFQRQDIYDWLRLRDYQPNAQIVELANSVTMNDHAKHIFYVPHPSVTDKTAFNTHCREDEQTIVLGCYVPPQRGIYLLAVNDPRLSGVLEVTAAHEMLHAAYDRLSLREKKSVDLMVKQAYTSIDNPRLRKTIDSYQQRGADTTNELHSILGTEIRVLPQELEDYYKKYFTDRIKIVDYSEQYEQAFSERKAQIEAYDTELKSLKTQIDENQADLEHESVAIENEREQLDQLLNSKQYAAYNAGVSAYNEKVRAYNSKLQSTRAMIDEYNGILEKRNAIVLEEHELFEAIDSRTLPSTAQ